MYQFNENTYAVTGDEDEEDDDRKIEQTDYNKALGTQDVDEEYLKFLTRIDRGHKSQVMRYCRWTNAYSHSTNSSQSSGVLLQSSSDVLKQKIRSVPRCEYCGAAREFEFQVITTRASFLYSISIFLLGYATIAVLSEC